MKKRSRCYIVYERTFETIITKHMAADKAKDPVGRGGRIAIPLRIQTDGMYNTKRLRNEKEALSEFLPYLQQYYVTYTACLQTGGETSPLQYKNFVIQRSVRSTDEEFFICC